MLSEFSRLVSTRAVGLEEICFYSGSVLGTHCCGALLDRAARPTSARAPAATGTRALGLHVWRSRRVVTVATLIHLAAFALAAASEARWAAAADSEGASGEIDLTDGRIAAPTAAFLLWGASDGFINTCAA